MNSKQVAIIVVVALLAAVLGAAVTLQVLGGQVVTKGLTGPGVTNFSTLAVASGLTVTAGTVALPASSVANAALAAPNSLVVLGASYARSFNNTTETEVARWRSPIAMTAITATASAQAVTGILTYTIWIAGVKQLCQLNVSAARTTTLCSTAQFTPSVAAHSAITIGATAAASDYVTDTFISLILKAVHQ